MAKQSRRRCAAAPLVVPMDLSDTDALGGLARQPKEELGRLDIVVNNLGGSDAPGV